MQLKKNIENLCKKNNKINFSKFVRLSLREKVKEKINTKLKMEIKLLKQKNFFKELKLFKRNSLMTIEDHLVDICKNQFRKAKIDFNPKQVILAKINLGEQ